MVSLTSFFLFERRILIDISNNVMVVNMNVINIGEMIHVKIE